MDLSSIIGDVIKGNVADKIGKQTGADQAQVESVISAALPVILGQLANNTSSKEGAEQLDAAVAKDHNGGSLFESLGSLFGGGQTNADGGKILEHVLGDKQASANDAISQKTGVDAATVAKILTFVAPLVLAYLGKRKAQGNLDAGGLSDMLDKQTSPSGNPLSQIATSILDKNGDGNIVDDLIGGFFKRG